LFLKYLDDLEKDKETAALLSGKTYERIIESSLETHFTHLAIF
jgi:type I restriction enzyme M protein